MWLEVHHGREPCGDVVAEERRHDFRAAVVGHIGEVGFGEQLHHVGVVEALGRKRAGAGEAVLAAFGLGLVHEILHAGDAGIGADAPAHREDVDLRHRGQILIGEAALLVLRDDGQHVGRGEADGIAVGTGAEHFIDADGLCAAGLVHDVDGDVVVLLEVVGEDARRDVDAASGAEGHDDVDGLVVGVFRPGIRVAADKQGTGDEQRGDDAFLHGNSILLIVWGTWAGDCPFQRADGIVPKGS